MHEFLQSGELKAQAKNLLSYRFLLVLAIVMNTVMVRVFRGSPGQAIAPTTDQTIGPPPRCSVFLRRSQHSHSPPLTRRTRAARFVVERGPPCRRPERRQRGNGPARSDQLRGHASPSSSRFLAIRARTGNRHGNGLAAHQRLQLATVDHPLVADWLHAVQDWCTKARDTRIPPMWITNSRPTGCRTARGLAKPAADASRSHAGRTCAAND